MFKATVTVKNETGLHARPATDLVALSQSFDSEITLYTEEEEINPKSIVSLLAGGVMQGDVVNIEISGDDEEEAGAAIVDFINNLTE